MQSTMSPYSSVSTNSLLHRTQSSMPTLFAMPTQYSMTILSLLCLYTQSALPTQSAIVCYAHLYSLLHLTYMHACCLLCNLVFYALYYAYLTCRTYAQSVMPSQSCMCSISYCPIVQTPSAYSLYYIYSYPVSYAYSQPTLSVMPIPTIAYLQSRSAMSTFYIYAYL